MYSTFSSAKCGQHLFCFGYFCLLITECTGSHYKQYYCVYECMVTLARLSAMLSVHFMYMHIYLLIDNLSIHSSIDVFMFLCV